VRATLNSTNGGSTDTEAKELMVTPTRSPPLEAVAIAMPVAKSPIESLNSRGVKTCFILTPWWFAASLVFIIT
jgi:hypothetical protein